MMSGMSFRAEVHDPEVDLPSVPAGIGRQPGVAGVAGAAGGPQAVVITGEDWLDAICPFLRARDGSWRSASPVREHRCWAADPPSELEVLTQQRLCLVRAHGGCERFLHARELRSASLAADLTGGGARPRSRLRVQKRAPGGVREEAASAVASGVAAVRAWPRRRRWSAVVGGAILVVLVLFMASGHGGAGVPVLSPSASGTGGEPPAFVDSSPGPDGLRRYRVRDGDTLRTIADRFGTTVRELRATNDLGNPPLVAPGDIILVPAQG